MNNGHHLSVTISKGKPNEIEGEMYLTPTNIQIKNEAKKNIRPAIAYNSIEKVTTNTKFIRITLKTGEKMGEIKRGLGLKNEDWDDFRSYLESKISSKSPYTRGSSARDLTNTKQLTNGHSHSNHHHHDDSKDVVHRGIRNSGNSCYFNAILQALAGLPTFICDLTDNRVKDAFILKDESCYKTFLQITTQCAERSQVPIDARKAQNAVSKHCKQFANKKQQDAHELLGTFLNILELEIFPFLKEKKEIYRKDRKAQVEIPLAERPGLYCPTKRNFSFLIKKQFCCVQCGDKPEVIEIFRDLSLEIFDNEDIEGWDRENLSKEVNDWIDTVSTPPSVRDMLQFYFLPEKIERLCKCGGNETIIKKSIASLPRILTLHIKRFIHSDSGMKKLKCKIEVDNELQLDNDFLAKPLQDTISFDVDHLPRNNRYTSETEDEEEDEEEKGMSELTEEEQIAKAKEESLMDVEIDEKQVLPKVNIKRTHEEMEIENFPCISKVGLPPLKKTKKDQSKYDEDTESLSDDSTGSEENSDSSKDVNALQEEIEELMLNSDNSGDSSEDLNIKYRLKCIVHHLGAKVTSGHYTAEILDHWKDIWYRYNDSKVTKSVPEMKACESAYILFYVHDSCWPTDLDYSDS
jgi:ubiquitin C-terminal hydrolase